jgi:hypothetical protein
VDGDRFDGDGVGTFPNLLMVLTPVFASVDATAAESPKGFEEPRRQSSGPQNSRIDEHYHCEARQFADHGAAALPVMNATSMPKPQLQVLVQLWGTN